MLSPVRKTGVVALALIGSAILYAWFALEYHVPMPSCGFRALTGHPCPFCGSTRALHSLAGGKFSEAIQFNPFILVGGAVLFLGACLAVFLPKYYERIWVKVNARHGPKFIFGSVIALVLINWLYLLNILP